MQSIRHMFRRHRNELKVAGWAAIGFFLIFCVLTVQLSATEDQTSRQSSGATAPPLPSEMLTFPAPSQQESWESIPTPDSDQQIIIMNPNEFHSTESKPVVRTSPGTAVPHANGPVYQTSEMIPGHASHPNTGYYHQELVDETIINDATYTESHSVPRSNYFGVDPNESCDEWSGFCGCSQNMFDRWCRDSGNKQFWKK